MPSRSTLREMCSLLLASAICRSALAAELRYTKLTPRLQLVSVAAVDSLSESTTTLSSRIGFQIDRLFFGLSRSDSTAAHSEQMVPLGGSVSATITSKSLGLAEQFREKCQIEESKWRKYSISRIQRHAARLFSLVLQILLPLVTFLLR